MATLREDLCTFMIISGLILLIMRNISDKSCKVNKNTRFTFNNFLFVNFDVYEIKWKNMVEPDRPQTTI